MTTIIDRSKSLRPRHPEKSNRPDTVPMQKPGWIRVKAPSGPGFLQTRQIIREHGLHTVCEEAGCPNIGECWEQAHATIAGRQHATRQVAHAFRREPGEFITRRISAAFADAGPAEALRLEPFAPSHACCGNNQQRYFARSAPGLSRRSNYGPRVRVS